VSSETRPSTRSSSNRPLQLILAVVGLIALVVGVIYLFFSHGHHNLRGATGLIVGVILLGLAWWVGRSKSRSASSS
jgi:protein-S-isoprenylcysteine O-methyltransferase Ste14